MVLPKRAAGHTYKPVQPPPQTNTGLLRPPSSGSTIRHLRRPSPLRTSVSANAAVGRRQSQSQSLSRSRSRSRSALRRPSPLRVRKAGQAPSADLVEQQNGVQGGQTQVSTQAQAPARPGSRGVANVSQERGQGRNVMAAPEKKNVGLSPDAASAAGHKRSPSKMWNEVMQRGRVEGGGGGGGGGAPIIVTTTPDSEGGIMSSPGAHKPQKSRMERYEAKVWAQGRDTSQSHSQGRAQGQVAKMRSLRTRKGRRKRLTGMMSSVGVGVGLGVSVNGNGTGAATGKSVHEQRGRERIRREPRGRVDGGTGTVVAS
ncbi:uncharacterized protein HMPREF1541_10182 [Cyphellophora europaea CBS 101466]|uniref:Uncharacterized protein n=1 Tax=Cyphellophora europaea (strain CBS 101466) TaxID=1220924 RepID=W2S755_CYPE1|nr:uncharacterized protein HMPREF1541_10182 [Cyphellophora europaea CBS 101466]ETN44512.1 hypothetical protein HMPREF1541_10182 [Cyphellophora europaea CBS 101466]